MFNIKLSYLIVYPYFHLQNKSAFLCGVMKTYRQREKQGTKVSDSTKGPDESKIKELLDRTNYTLDVTTGQRKYGGPPPETVYSGVQPTIGTEVPAPLYFHTRKFCRQNTDWLVNKFGCKNEDRVLCCGYSFECFLVFPLSQTVPQLKFGFWWHLCQHCFNADQHPLQVVRVRHFRQICFLHNTDVIK